VHPGRDRRMRVDTDSGKSHLQPVLTSHLALPWSHTKTPESHFTPTIGIPPTQRQIDIIRQPIVALRS